ncbi:MAG: dihydroorotase family protein [Candidatus Bathyarchaeota archaeon]|nr:dihydroorotase family protein [Candidatus Bathyarchaeota archaeon]
MIVDSIINNAKAYLKGEIVDCCFAIEEGKIQKIGKETHMPKADQKIDLHHLLVIPGVIDSHVHLRDENKAYKETFQTGTAAAAAGGVTTVLDMPNNSPMTMSVETLRNRMQTAARRVLVNVGFYSEFPVDKQKIKAIAEEGAFGFKLFMAEQLGGLNVDDDQALREAFEATAQAEVPVAVHAEDHQLLKGAVEKSKLAHKNDMNAFLKAHSENVESASVERLLAINAQIEKMHLHVCHISTQKAVQAVAEAKRADKNVTCEVTPHHLLLTREDYEKAGTSALTMPPLRSRENVDALWKALNDGSIDTVGSDHAPHTLQEKDAATIWEVKVGVPGLETTLPLILTAVHKNRVTFSRVLEVLCEKPAEIFHLTDRGKLDEGKNADLTVVDFNAKFKIDVAGFKSKAKFSPFNKLEMQGKPVKTFVNGELVMDEGEIVVKPGSGLVIRRAHS